MSIGDVILIIFLILLIWPLFQTRILEARRYRYIREIEEKRKSRLITLIDRRRGVSLLGLSLSEIIDIEDAEEILRAIRFTPDNMPIDLVIHTPGGLELATEQIAYALLGHNAKVTIFVPHFALSGGTLLALAADEIVMDEYALLGRLDPQIFGLPAVSVNSVAKKKPANKIDDQTLVVLDVAEKAVRRTREVVERILEENKYEPAQVKKIMDSLTSGWENHDDPITFNDAQKMGLRVSSVMMKEIYGLLRLYPPRRGGPSPVQYIPVPYR